ncbi:ABC transporter substrate-binding protein [Thermaerobacillus caldiproteolyticus]|uniref:Iron complex transport system substrate-binding protein n=1 Tax=Thermaerobacillus caldiproteolyticus TaxID=247480 RepID=A0A7V9Z6Y2_9BACL|nr:iron-siderophore ABC transporter substrate-binding protein [Anoxybacillus caldiproteolyticus]MBA2875210.1 iron complex transport system substrate-binding protein [Anoxybacillus caldiproteolyticus]QPA32848.1 iron-siderophore ABC transporter substrate-binding protein [Anoxybacillus caldiproteolyticus]
MFKPSRCSLLATIVIALLLVLAGCGSKEEAEPKQTGEKTEKSTSYTVKHAMETTEIKGTPKRVVILTNEGTEALLALGVKPVGAVKSWTGNPWYDHIKDKMDGVKVVGTEGEPNLEAIAALKPDLIIGNKLRHEKIYEQLKAIAPTVFSETLRGNWQENFTLYAKAVNKEEKGKEVIAEYNQRIEDLKAKLGDKLKMKVSIVRFMSGDVRIYHKDSFSGVILDQLGFARPESQNANDFAETGVTKERIPAMDGDILFYFTYEQGDGAATKLEKEWINDPLFKNLNVSKQGKVYKVSDTIWNTAGGVLAANLMLDDIEKYFLEQ